MVKKTDIVLAAASGILLVLAFPLFDIYPLAWVSLVPLLTALRDKNSISSFYLGFLTGLVYFLGTTYWVYHSMYYYGHVPLAFSILLLIALSSYLALYTGIFSVLFNSLAKKSFLPAIFVAPVLWVSLEYLRTYALTGFPWSVLGYSQHTFLPLIQVSDITGVYGISFLVVSVNGFLCDILSSRFGKANDKPSATCRQITVSAIILALLISASLFYGIRILNEDLSGEKVRVSVIQGNIAQDKKWDARFQREVIDTYKRLSTKALSDNPDIMIWPESALPFVFGYDKPLTEEIVTFQKRNDSYFLFGSVVVSRSEHNKSRLSNSAVLLSPEGHVESVYDKIHLVPYGEYVPLQKLFPFVDKMVTAIGDFARGKETTVMETPFGRIGNLICYEIIFPGLVRKFVDSGANILVTITNDAWFGTTAAPYQHFSMAIFRAIENRVPVVRAANTGISGFIDSKGRVINKSDIFVEAKMTEEISTGTKKSFYAEYGDIFASFCIISSVLLFGSTIFFGRRKNFS